jgi:dTMP kinase
MVQRPRLARRSRRKPRGLFVVLEGIDGSGTTTQLTRLTAALERLGHDVCATNEPTDGAIGRLLRAALRGEERFPHDTIALLFAADRLDHVASVIEPALARGEIVLCDRYLLSSLVYQSRFSPRSFVCDINARARAPDLTLLLDVPANVAQKRREARGGPRELFDAAELQRVLARSYREIARGEPGDVRIVDGTGAPAVVESRLLEAIQERLRVAR